ncbi:MAG: hypothetical protein EWV81_05620 [Microcystis aeruginosa Ma_SC_T_19800800_S464]|uniref:Uncharacterized protein n=1 Tax=Microcystis aeruginosa Ma_SC_T_19800800_S464 TaxID=2486257 RepID=A0A552E1A8_MICAE|nr:MAG: hypothetical protein EWV81_05620 [Microcystis aeruginosa Ma_SC_T_19800800_S464]
MQKKSFFDKKHKVCSSSYGRVGKWGSGEVGKWGSGEVGKWGSGGISTKTPKPYHPKTLSPDH